MSTSTRIRYTPVVTTKVKGSEGIDLHELLGPEGRALLRATLDELSSRTAHEAGESAPLLDWHLMEAGQGATGDGVTYELVLERGALMRELTAAGIETLTVRMRLEGAVAQVSREASGRSGQKMQVPEAARAAIRVQANRAANMVIAHALSNKLSQAVRQKSKVPVQQKIVNGLNIRMYAQIKG
jgi:hypothetical protein